MKNRPRLLAATCAVLVGLAQPGGAQTGCFATSSVECDEVPVMTTRGSDILDATGQPFVARGINLQYGDFPRLAATALPLVHDVGANIVRLQLRRATAARQIDEALTTLSRDPVVVMLALWEEDLTGGTEPSDLTRDVRKRWLGKWLPVLLDPKYADRLMLNIVNEWGSDADSYEVYLQTYETIITQFRDAGLRHPIVIDAGNWGSDPSFFLDGRAAHLVAADPLENVIFSLHAYHERYNTPEKIDAIITDMESLGVPWMWGEFGSSSFEPTPGGAIDHLHLMARSAEHDIGWIAWSWYGNGGRDAVLDITTYYDRIDMTPHGMDVIQGTHGLAATAVPANFAE